MLSITIADILLDSPDKQEVAAQLCHRINQAIQISNRDTMNALKGFVSPDEQGNIFSREQPGVLESIERLRKSADLSLIELGSMRKTVLSKSGNIRLVISGAKIILALEINRDFLSSKNKNILEEELRDSVNAAIQEVENDIGKIIKSVEAGFYESVNRG
jgi:DNA-binding protein YbaB